MCRWDNKNVPTFIFTPTYSAYNFTVENIKENFSIITNFIVYQSKIIEFSITKKKICGNHIKFEHLFFSVHTMVIEHVRDELVSQM